MSESDPIFVNPVRVLKVSELDKIVGAASGQQFRYKTTSSNDNQGKLPE